MNKTAIEWVKNPDGTQGATWNPITGCKNQINGMCQGGNFPCYAYRLANTRLRGVYCANSNLPTHNESDHEAHHSDPFYPRFWEDRLSELAPPLGVQRTRGDNQDMRCHKRASSKGIFTCDMSDLFGIGIPEEWTYRVMTTIKLNPRHRFYLLTKQPQNLIKFSPFPDNCFVGVTATNAQMFIDAGQALKDIDAEIKYISAEPLLSWNLGGSGFIATMLQKWGINQVIIGAQTKPTVYPKIEWVEEIVGACDKAGIPVFLKDNLSDLIPVNSNLRYGPAGELRLRQELPVDRSNEVC